jgi:hypothetical protein
MPFTPTTAQLELLAELDTARMPAALIADRLGIDVATFKAGPRAGFGLPVRGGSCDCVPNITLRLPDGSLVDVDQAGRVLFYPPKRAMADLFDLKWLLRKSKPGTMGQNRPAPKADDLKSAGCVVSPPNPALLCYLLT